MMNINWTWIKDTDGNPSATLSFAIVAFLVVITKVLFGGMSVVLGNQTFTLMPIDAGTIGALLTPTLGSYVARRWTTAKFEDLDNDGIADNEEPHGSLSAKVVAEQKKEGENG